MRIPKRRGEELRRSQQEIDHHLTAGKILAMKREVERLKESLPERREEVRRTQEMGDLSENAAYQLAKADLRRAQNRILSLEDRLKFAIPITEGGSTGIVRLGSKVTVSVNNERKTFVLVGAQEASPHQRRISHTSPLGSALLGRAVHESVVVTTPAGEIRYKILEIE